MSISINTNYSTPTVFKSTPKEPQPKEKPVDSKKILIGLGAAGVTVLGILAAKGKFKKKPKTIKDIIGKDPKVEKLTKEEMEKLIKELQSKTDNPDTKEEIRKLVECGEWDKL